jgi:hypothetical protein
VLLVADWSVAPEAVVGAARRLPPATSLALVVPATLHGLDWAGDPYASVPCARRQLDAITALAAASGVSFDDTAVGDPELLAAIDDALADWPADQLLLCAPRRRLSAPYPFDPRTRARRLTGIAVEILELPRAPRATGRRRWPRLRSGHCVLEPPPIAASFAAPR